MIEFLQKARSKYHLSLGIYTFSPIMEASIALSLSYRDLHLKSKQQYPFYLSFPDKNLASVWLSISLLINFFLEDYVNHSDSEEITPFAKGDKVEIFDVIAEIESVSKDKIILKFSDQGGIPINNRLKKQVNPTTKKRINKKSLFVKNYKAAKLNRNTISKILEPFDSITINENHLSSQVLLVTGRGNAKQLRSVLKASEIYDEPLNAIFIENKNLLIKKDLEAYKNVFDPFITEKERLFKELLLKFLKETNELETTSRNSLLQLLETNEFLTTDFKEKLEDLIEFYGDNFPGLRNIYSRHPGVRENIPTNIKAVVINEIEQINLYKNTISGFLNSGIPVFVVSDRHVKRSTDMTLLKDLFTNHSSALRINWNRKKIRKLNEISKENSGYLDEKLWKNCLRYSSQNININVCKTSPLDKLIYESQKVIKNLIEFESIQKAYYKCLYPAAYLFKNSSKSNEAVVELAGIFDVELQKNRSLLDPRVYILLKETVDFLKTTNSNNKQIQNIRNTFSNLLPVNLDKKIFIPSDSVKINIPDSSSEIIFFSGYPYDEFSGGYLINAVCYDYVPDITIACWPIESQLTYNYLKKRISAGYFTDNLHAHWKHASDLLLNSEQDFENEISDFLNYNVGNPTEERKYDSEQELDLFTITNFKYKGYNNALNSSSSYRLKCDILNFNDGSFLFLPKNSKVLAQIETDDGSLKFKNSLFSDLEVGFKVFRYKKDRSDFRDLAMNNLEIKKAFSELELWKKSLLHLFQACNSSLDELEKELSEVKIKNSLTGNPSRNNIQRWLFDEELIAPEIDNIKIIFYAIGLPDIDKTLKTIQLAYNTVVSYTISLSSKIKKSITKKLSQKQDEFDKSFKLNINNVEIDVESRIITGLEKSEIEIEYHNTRRIII